MDLKKEFFHRKIKQETENEAYSNISETFPNSNNHLQIKFEDTTFNIEPEDEIESTLKAIVNGTEEEEPTQVKKCIPLTKNLDVELVSNKQICRLCAQTIASTEIFLYEDGDLEQKVNYTLPITMGLGDGLPEYICQNCEVNLNMFYEFVCQVVNADKTIRQRINPPDIKTNEVIKQIFGSDEEDEVNEDPGVLEEEPNECLQENRMLEPEISEGYVADGQLFEEKSGKLQNRILEEESKHLPDLKIPINEKKPNKHLIQDDDNFPPHKIQKICILDPKPVEQYKCLICKEFFPDYFVLADHVKETHKKKQFVCPESYCNEIFTTQNSLRQHISDTHNGPVICYKCGKIFTHPEMLNKHRKNFHYEKVCQRCGMSFKTAISSKTHQLMHAEVSEFQCVYCYKDFQNRHKLHRHTRQSHSGNFTMLVDTNEDEVKKKE